jgi:hypothetical protein
MIIAVTLNLATSPKGVGFINMNILYLFMFIRFIVLCQMVNKIDIIYTDLCPHTEHQRNIKSIQHWRCWQYGSVEAYLSVAGRRDPRLWEHRTHRFEPRHGYLHMQAYVCMRVRLHVCRYACVDVVRTHGSTHRLIHICTFLWMYVRMHVRLCRPI